jgi:hypothetical protein
VATRRERVVIELEDGLTAGVLREAAAVAVLNRELDKLGRGSTSAKRSIDPLANETLPKTTRNADSAGKSIDKLSGRIELFAHGLAAIDPAAVPIGAVAIPAISTLASGLGFLTVGAGTTVLAFHNLGDALTKFNKAAAEPTATNIAAAQAAMDKIGPSAQQFVLELHKLGPELVRLQEAAGSGLFPGLTAGIHEAQAALPAVERIFHRVGTEMGNLSAEAGQSLGGPEWAPFLKFIGDEAPHALSQMGHALGSVTHGLAELWMATQPLNSGGLDWIENAANGFDRWATGIDQTQGFQDFLAYIQTHGPEVEQLLSDTASLFVDIVKAAAPLGGPTLHALDLLVKLLDTIASTPLATPLLALLQINSVLKLTSSGLGAVGINADLNLRKKLVGGAKAGAASLLEVTSAQDRARLSSQELARVEAERAQAQRSALIKGGAAIAAFGFVTSGAADKMGVTQTATLALTGAMLGGVPGAVAGGLIGAVMDYRSAAGKASAITDTLGRSMRAAAGDIAAQTTALNQAQAAHDAMVENHRSFGYNVTHPFESTAYLASSLDGSTPGQDVNQTIEAQRVQLDNLKTAYGALFDKLKGSPTGPGGSSLVLTTQQLQTAATRAEPAMAALGITADDLQKAAEAGDGSIGRLTHQIIGWINNADSAKGRTDAVSNAFAAMGDDSLTADQRVQALSDSLDALLSPRLNLSAATDAWHKGLSDLNTQLKGSRVGLNDFSDAAINNKEVIRQQVENLSAMIKAQAEVDPNAKRLTATLKTQRQALVDAGAEAGISRKAMNRLLDAYGLTPKLIRTTIQAVGVAAAEKKLNWLTRDRIAQIKVNVSNDQGINVTGGHIARADGGSVPGPRRPYGDKVLAALAPGEEIISNRYGQADQFRADRAAGRIPGYADGGTVGARSYQHPDKQTQMTTVQHTWSSRAPEIDYDRLTRALLAARPLYGDVKISGDPTAFRRETEQDRRRAAMGSVASR